MVASNPDGIMGRNTKALADFTAPDGLVKKSVIAEACSDISRRFGTSCRNAGAITVHVITRRKNTSVVAYRGETWYVPNIDVMTPTADCLKDGQRVAMTGRIESAFAQMDEVDPKKGYHYPRLTLDAPVCYLGNEAEKAGRHISLVATSDVGITLLSRMVGQHVTISGVLTGPDTGNQPPDNMMMLDPVVRPAG